MARSQAIVSLDRSGIVTALVTAAPIRPEGHQEATHAQGSASCSVGLAGLEPATERL
jgi:hypothetical protein